MTLIDLASIGSFISGVAVVVTLVFLVIQLRQTNKNQRALMQQGRCARVVDSLLRSAEPSVSEAMTRAYLADMSMDASQVYTANSYARALFLNVEDSFLQHRAGLLEEASWATDIATLRVILTTPAYRVAWKMSRHLVGGDYCKYVDSLVREVKVSKPIDELSAWKALMTEELVVTV